MWRYIRGVRKFSLLIRRTYSSSSSFLFLITCTVGWSWSFIYIYRYGFLNRFRFTPTFPNQVYRFDPDTGDVRVVADQFVRSNGIAFNSDGSEVFMYVPLLLFRLLETYLDKFLIWYSTDTGLNAGFMGNNSTLPATMYVHYHQLYVHIAYLFRLFMFRYQYDVDSNSETFKNRRVFAYVDTGIADGVQLDTRGNVFAGTGDGVSVSLSSSSLSFAALFLSPPPFHYPFSCSFPFSKEN